MTQQDRERIARLESNRAALARLAREFEEEAGLNRPIAESVGDVITRDYEDTDFAQVLSEREINDTLVQLLAENREQVERALYRLSEGKYGECEDCGEPIPTERLRFRPEATRCVDCQSRWDRVNRRTA
jgi:DnaK suppressor protein